MLLQDLMSMNPWREMDRIREEMNRLFNGVSRPTAEFFPAMNVWTNQEEAIITAELPGYQIKDLQLTISKDELHLKGSRKPEELQEGMQLHRQERSYGEFERSVRLPFLVDVDKVTARLENGILKLTLPRAEADKPKKISIQTS